MRFPRPDDSASEEEKGRYYFGLALALGMVLGALLIAFFEYTGMTDLLSGWP